MSEKMCPLCNRKMKTVYIRETRVENKTRKQTWVPLGFVCIPCIYVDIDSLRPRGEKPRIITFTRRVPPPPCEFCGSKHVIRFGSYMTRKGKQTRLKCENCGKTFNLK